MENNFIITGIDRVIMVGPNEYKSLYTSFSNNLKYNELIFHFSGQSTVYFDNLVLETNPNTIRFLPEGSFSRYDVLRREHGECIFVAFSADRPISDKAFVISSLRKESIGNLFKKMFSVWIGKGDGYYFETISILYKIFAEIQKERYTPAAHYLKIKPAADFIHDRFLKEELSVSALSNMCGIKESYFKRLFKEKYGMPPKKYIIQLKINHACELLRLKEYSVTEIAEICNFSDIYFFSRQFKEYVGITPTQFAEKYKSSK